MPTTNTTSHAFFPVYAGILLWAGIFLRESRLPALISSAELAHNILSLP